MNLRTQRSLYRVTASLLLLGAALIALQAAFVSTLPERVKASKPSVHSDVGEPAPAPRDTIDPESRAWTMSLQRPLYDPPPPPPPPVVKKELPPIRSILLGTILEPGASRAMIRLPGGQVEFRGLGDPLGDQDPDAVVTEIGSQSIRVARGEVTTELKVDRGY